MEKREYPSRAEDYELYEMIGDGGSAVVHRARCIPFDEIVAIKILDIEKNSDLTNICHEAQTMKKINHRNVLKSHCSFVNDHDLWVVMPYMAGGSCLHIMKSAYPNGFEEVIIATILREVLKGLEYLHENGNIHRDIKAGNILIDSHGGVKLGDFGVSASLFDSGDRQRRRNTFVGTPCWMAPEVMEQVHGYDFKADIWSFGITALELAHGHAPFSSQPPVKVLLMTLQNAPPSLESSKDKKFSKSFKHMIAMCLVKDPSKRPTAHKLLKQPFFKQAKSDEYIEKKILVGLPALEDRFHTLKATEAELLADKKMLDVEKEALSQNEYKRGISNWNFDIDVIKAQAALMPDTEDVVSDKSLSFSGELDVLHENSPTSCVKKDPYLEETNGIPIVRDSHSSLDQSLESQIPQSEGHENEYYTCGNSSNQNIIHENGFKTHMNLSCESKTDEWHVKHNALVSNDNHSTSTSSCSLDSLQSFKQESLKQHNKVENVENDMPHGTTEMPSEPMVKISKPTALNCDDGDEKSRPTVVQQKGRFKVTSENVDKAHSNRSQSTSHSEQLETAEEKEKRLIQEIADLQKRLLLSEEELRRTREKISQLKNTNIKLDS